MKKLLLWLLIVLMVAVFSLSCGLKLEQVEINVSKSIKEAIEEAAPVGEYCFYALKESYPENVAEMNKAKLFVCGEVKTDAGLEVVFASLDDSDTMLFKSIYKYYI